MRNREDTFKPDVDRNDMTYFLAGLIAGTLTRAETRAMLKQFDLLGGAREPTVTLRFRESGQTYTIRVEAHGALSHDDAHAAANEEAREL